MKTLKTFDFALSGRSRYDWDTLLDGTIYQMTEGEDFDCKVNTLTTLLRDRAKKRGKRVQISVGEGVVTFQATNLEQEKPVAKKPSTKKGGKKSEPREDTEPEIS